MGKSKIQDLTTEWYGFNAFVCLVNVLLAIFGSGIFAVLTVPFVLGFSVISFLITFVLGRLLLKKSAVTRYILLVLAPIAFVLELTGGYEMLRGPWSISMLVTLLVVAGAAYMQAHSFLTLMHKDVRSYFR